MDAAVASLGEALPREELLARMERVMGKFPGAERRCDLDVKVLEEVDCGEYVRKFLTYQSEPGGSVPAYLLVPKAEVLRKGPRGKAIGILALHQTHALGQKVVVGLGASTNDEYGVELAKRGFVCLAPAYPWLAKTPANSEDIEGTDVLAARTDPTAVDSLSTVDVADLSSGVTTVVLAGKERLLGRPSQH